ncbi:uncharacterized protein LOC110041696 [Orbicella faveolata]|uniref:uncharacterized protein LOC110041696 n=1 Tax=Orbicella faveolata TaxID=48498 RepID=UPI0009E1D3FB|nr:uncharacterized protein LOC110041696 [Orbicella faveolata]
MGSKIWLIAVLLLAVSVGLEAFPVALNDDPTDFKSDDLSDDLTERDVLYEDNYEMGYPDVDNVAAAVAASDDDDDDGNELEDYEGALDEMGLEDPRWSGTLRLPRPRDRRPRSPQPKRRRKKTGRRGKGKRGGKKSSRQKGRKRHGRPPRKSGNKKGKKKGKGG